MDLLGLDPSWESILKKSSQNRLGELYVLGMEVSKLSHRTLKDKIISYKLQTVEGLTHLLSVLRLRLYLGTHEGDGNSTVKLQVPESIDEAQVIRWHEESVERIKELLDTTMD